MAQNKPKFVQDCPLKRPKSDNEQEGQDGRSSKRAKINNLNAEPQTNTKTKSSSSPLLPTSVVEKTLKAQHVNSAVIDRFVYYLDNKDKANFSLEECFSDTYLPSCDDTVNAGDNKTAEDNGNEAIRPAAESETGSEQELSHFDAVHHVVNNLIKAEDWKGLKIGVFCADNYSRKRAGNSEITKEDFLAKVKGFGETQQIEMEINGEEIDLDVKLSAIEAKIRSLFPEDVTPILASTILPALKTKDRTYQYNSELVKASSTTGEGDRPSYLDGKSLLNDNRPEKKNRVIVVAGESGSGKTWFSCFGLHEKNVLYYALKPDEFSREDRNQMELKGNSQLETLKGVRKMLTACARTVYKKMRASRWNGLLFDALTDTAKSRNTKVLELLDDIVSVKVAENISGKDKRDAYLRWAHGLTTPAKKPLEQLVFVLDEAGVNLAFSEGVVDVGRRFVKDRFLDRGLAKSCTIVLCGTGLDAIIDSSLPDSGGCEYPVFGATDPGKSKVVLMNKPCLESLRGVKDGIKKGIRRGVYSSLLAENARMLMRGLLPLFLSKFAHQSSRGGGHSRALEEDHYAECGSSRPFMRYPVEIYSGENCLRLLANGAQRDEMMMKVFGVMRMKAIKQRRDALLAKGCHLEPADTDTIQQLFTDNVEAALGKLDPLEVQKCGLVTVDIKDTSRALKLLACGGLSLPVIRTSDGLAFEALIEMHLTRLCNICGIELNRHQLRTDWPSANLSNACAGGQHSIDHLKCSTEANNDIAIISGHLSKENSAVVFTQSSSIAQGPDVFFAYRPHKGNVFLVAIHAKNTKDVAKSKAFSSLGLGDCNTVTNDMTNPDDPKKSFCAAGYSGKAIETMASRIGGKVGKIVGVVRVVALTKNLAFFRNHSQLWGSLNGKECSVWTSECFEPTISVFPPTLSS